MRIAIVTDKDKRQKKHGKWRHDRKETNWYDTKCERNKVHLGKVPKKFN